MDVINIETAPPYPSFTLPAQPSHFKMVLDHTSQDIVDGLQITSVVSREIELQTRTESSTQVWHDLRKEKLTSSIFKQICGRRKYFETLAARQLQKKHIQTAAMKYGLEHEPEAANLYGEVLATMYCSVVLLSTPLHHTWALHLIAVYMIQLHLLPLDSWKLNVQIVIAMLIFPILR